MKKFFSISKLSGFTDLCQNDLLKVGGKGECRNSFGHVVYTPKPSNNNNNGGVKVEVDWGIVQSERSNQDKTTPPPGVNPYAR